MAQVFGSDLASVSLGDSAEVLTGIDSKSLPGRVDNISALVDPDTRSVVVRVVAENPGNLLKKQMYVRVLIRARQESTGLLVPVSAILRDDENLPFVYLAQSDGSFARRHVTLSYRAGEQYDIAGRSQGRRPNRRRRGHLRSVHAKSMSEPAAPDRIRSAQAFDHESNRGLFAAPALSHRADDGRCSSAPDTRSLDRLPVDAYPDLSPPMVEVITQWPGRAAEEVERLITVPVEREMNGIPQMTTIRSISLYGLSDVILTFENGTDNYFARQQVFNRMRRPQSADRRDAFGGADVIAVGSHLSLRAAEPRPFADGTQDFRGLDRRAPIQIRSRRGG